MAWLSHTIASTDTTVPQNIERDLQLSTARMKHISSFQTFPICSIVAASVFISFWWSSQLNALYSDTNVEVLSTRLSTAALTIMIEAFSYSHLYWNCNFSTLNQYNISHFSSLLESNTGLLYYRIKPVHCQSRMVGDW